MTICELTRCRKRAELIILVDDRELLICRKCWKKLVRLGKKWAYKQGEANLSDFIVIKRYT